MSRPKSASDEFPGAVPPRRARTIPALSEVLGEEVVAALDEHALITVHDAEGKFLFVTDRFCALTQYTREELLGQSHRLVLPDHASEKFLHDIGAALANGRTWKGEISQRAKDGSIHWVDATIMALPDASGTPGRYIAVHTDLTPVKQLQDSLRENERRYLDLVQIAPDGMFIDDGGVISFVNAAGVALLRAHSAEEILGRAAFELFHPDRHDAIRQRRDVLLRGPGALPASEETMMAMDGAEIPVEVRAVSFLDQGRIKVLATCRDISEHRRMDERLRQERDYSDAVLNSLPGTFYHFDDQGRFLRWNRNFERVTGYSAAEIPAMHALDFFPEDERPRIAAKVAEVFETGHAAVEADFVSKDGRRTHYLMTGVRFEHDGRRELVGIGTDIDRHKRTEDALRESLHRFDAAVRATGDVVWDWDLGTNAIWWNDNFQTLFGWAADEIEPTIESWHRRIHPEDQERVLAYIRDIIDGTGETWQDEYRFLRKDGTWADLFDRGHVLRDAAGRGVRMVGAMQDITERKKAQAQLLAFNIELEHRVADRTRELQMLNRELESFCYSVSHDLRAPLRGIAGFTEILARDYVAALDDRARDYFGRVLAATQRMGELIDDLLELSRVSRDEMHRETVDLSVMARDVVAALRSTSPERQVEVIVDEGLRAEGDARLLRILLENLLGNAWKFTSKTTAARIAFGRGEAAPDFVVSDNGAGFDMRYAGKLFGPFQRLHRATEFPGTGIGLATVQRIVNRHGGRISAHAEPGKGATFQFSFDQPAHDQ